MPIAVSKQISTLVFLVFKEQKSNNMPISPLLGGVPKAGWVSITSANG